MPCPDCGSRRRFSVGSELKRLTEYAQQSDQIPHGRLCRTRLRTTITVLENQTVEVGNDPDLGIPIAVVRDFEGKVVQTAFCDIEDPGHES